MYNLKKLPANYLGMTSSDPIQADPLRWVKRALAIGYLSHLALDSMTPKGLPLLA